uniref:THAP domain containing 7 n=1 Tax=Ursus maritimus TaxID=29073 RepID=A0A452TBM9_URSMA
MPRHCSAAGCCTRDTRETRNRGISFHRLPKKDNPRRGLWLPHCQRLDPSGQGLWDPASEYIYFCSKHFEENCFELVGISGYHRLKEGAVPTIFESFSKLRRTTKTKGHSYPPGPPDVSRLRRCRKRCSEGRGPTTPFSPPPPADVTCFPVEEASAPAALPASPTGRLEAGLSSPFSDLLGPLGAQADEAGCSAQPSPEREPERQPSPLEPRPVSPSAYMLRLPPPAGAYIQNEHSYQVGSALLWKRRAEAALDALDNFLAEQAGAGAGTGEAGAGGCPPDSEGARAGLCHAAEQQHGVSEGLLAPGLTCRAASWAFSLFLPWNPPGKGSSLSCVHQTCQMPQ